MKFHGNTLTQSAGVSQLINTSSVTVNGNMNLNCMFIVRHKVNVQSTKQLSSSTCRVILSSVYHLPPRIPATGQSVEVRINPHFYFFLCWQLLPHLRTCSWCNIDRCMGCNTNTLGKWATSQVLKGRKPHTALKTVKGNEVFGDTQ